MDKEHVYKIIDTEEGAELLPILCDRCKSQGILQSVVYLDCDNPISICGNCLDGLKNWLNSPELLGESNDYI